MSESWFLSQDEVAARTAALLDKIHTAWDGIQLGRGVSIEHAQIEYVTPRESYRERRKRRSDKAYMRRFEDWTAVDLDSDEYEIPVHAPFMSLDPEAFRFYIPAFLRMWLEAGLPDMLDTKKLRAPGEPEDRLAEFIVQCDVHADRFRELMSLLSAGQHRCMAEFFALAIESGVFPEDDGWPAVMRLWGDHLDRDHRERIRESHSV